MLNTTHTNDNPKNLVDYAEQKRIALREALVLRPNSLKLLKAKQQLTGPRAISIAASTGVFISYSNADDVFALELAEKLKEHTIKAWLDIFEILNDSDWNLEITRALKRCGLLIAVLSPHSIRNEALITEWENSQNLGKLIQPVIYESCQIPQFDFGLPAIDFSQNYEQGLRTLLRQFR